MNNVYKQWALALSICCACVFVAFGLVRLHAHFYNKAHPAPPPPFHYVLDVEQMSYKKVENRKIHDFFLRTDGDKTRGKELADSLMKHVKTHPFEPIAIHCYKWHSVYRDAEWYQVTNVKDNKVTPDWRVIAGQDVLAMNGGKK